MVMGVVPIALLSVDGIAKEDQILLQILAMKYAEIAEES